MDKTILNTESYNQDEKDKNKSQSMEPTNPKVTSSYSIFSALWDDKPINKNYSLLLKLVLRVYYPIKQAMKLTYTIISEFNLIIQSSFLFKTQVIIAELNMLLFYFANGFLFFYVIYFLKETIKEPPDTQDL